MTRLIDADVLIKQCKPRGIADEVWKESNEYKQIINAPTIDAVKVVRCRDCKWYDKGENEVDAWSICIRTYGIKDDVSESDYCSWGERREDGEV